MALPYSFFRKLIYGYTKMTKTKKAKIRQSVKTIKIDDRFLVHKLAKVPYKIFCESVNDNLVMTKNKVEPKIPLIEITEYRNNFLFFDDFETLSSLSYGDKLSIRRVDISNADIEKRAWGYLLNHLVLSEPLNLELLHSLKNIIPNPIQECFFDGSFTIQYILDKRGMPRHKYDYRLQKHGGLNSYQLPSFSDLIQEVRNDSK